MTKIVCYPNGSAFIIDPNATRGFVVNRETFEWILWHAPWYPSA